MSNGRLMVVDDTPQNVKLLADLLGAKGYSVTTAACGEDALAMLATDVPDLVLLDVMMPGLSGYDVCKRIRADARTQLLPVVLVTSLDPHRERLAGIEAGADDFLSKPINQPELLARVRSLLRIKLLQDEVARQAITLAEWNASLEQRVAQQVSQLERLARLKRFFSAPIADAIVSAGEESILAPHRRDICYVFADLRGFTRFTDTAEPEEVQAMLHAYHETMGALVTQFEGTIDRFAGDGILIFFNDPFPMADAATRAARMALAMHDAMRELRAHWAKEGYELDLGIGIARGFATLGAFGYEGRWDYSAIGGVVNLASRLCDEARGGQTLIDRRMHAAVEAHADTEPVGPLALKGYAQPVNAYELKAVRGASGAQV